MIRRKAIRKIYVTILSLFIILVVCTIKNMDNVNTIRTNVLLEDVASINNQNIYLLNSNGYLVKKGIFIEYSSDLDKIYKVIGSLKESNSYNNLFGVLDKNIVLLDVLYDEGYVSLKFDDKFKDLDNLDTIVSSICYSLFDNSYIKGITIYSGDNIINGYPKIISRNIDINKETLFTNREDIQRVVVYYVDRIDNNNYYVPVTKYLNDSRDKINVIVDLMKSSTTLDLVSYVSNNIELINYREENDTMILNFNNYLFDSNNKILEEVLYCISYSVFDNYDIDMVMLEVNGKNIKQISRNNG